MMEFDHETTSTLNAVEEIVKTFETSRELYQKWREKRRRKQPAEEELEVSMVLAAEKLKSRSRELEDIWGLAFNKGDGMTSINQSFSRTLIGLNRYIQRWTPRNLPHHQRITFPSSAKCSRTGTNQGS
jgi:hypothetical protein